MKAKKDFPIAVIKQIKDFEQNAHKHGIKKEDYSEVMFRVSHEDSESDYFFEITRHEISSGNVIMYSLKYKPENRLYNRVYTVQVPFNKVQSHFDTWYDMAREFSELEFWGEDPFVAQYAKEFYETAELIDDNADKPMDSHQIEWFDKLLSVIEQNIDSQVNEINKADVDEIKKEAKHLKQVLTRSTKKEAFKSFSKIVGRIKKAGLPVLKYIASKAVEVGLKVVLEAGFKGMLGT